MRQFLKQALASTVGSLLGLTLFSAVSIAVVSVTIGVLIQSATESNSTIKISDKSILKIDLSQSIVDINPGKTLQETIAGEATNVIELKSVLNSIDAATTDKRILAIYLDGSNGKLSTTGFATLKEVRTALERFRASGKKIIAYNIDMDKRDYYLSSVADRIFINPMGSVDINGFRSETMFFKNAFDKYGIGVEVVRVGKYKSFGETWSLAKFSPAARQETQQLLNNLWGDFKTSVGSSRQLTPESIQKMSDDRGMFTAAQSIKNKLVDRVAYPDQMSVELKKISGADEENKTSFRHIDLENYAELANKKQHNSSQKIAVIYAQGSIVSGEGGAGQIGGDSLARQLRELRGQHTVSRDRTLAMPHHLRLAGRAGRREHEVRVGARRVVLPDGTPGPFGQRIGHRFVDHAARPTAPHEVGHLRLAVARVHRNEHQAGRGEPGDGLQVREPVGQPHGHPIAGHESLGAQALRETAAARRDVGRVGLGSIGKLDHGSGVG